MLFIIIIKCMCSRCRRDDIHVCFAYASPQRMPHGQVGYVPAAYLMIIVDETHQEEENDTDRRDGHERRTDGTKIGGEMGQDGERRKKYSAAVIDGIKRKSRIFVGDSIVRKTDS